MPAKERGGILTLRTPFLATVCGRRGSGKTTLMKYILRTLARRGDIKDVFVVSSTLFTQDWMNVVGEDRCFGAEDVEDILRRILDRQAHARESGRPNPALLILDDVLGSFSFAQPIWSTIASTGRHYDLSVILATQHYFAVPPLVRLNSDYFALLGPTSDRAWKQAYNEFSPTKTAQELREWGSRALAPIGAAVVIDQRDPPHLKVLRAPSRVEFRIS